ncbi:OprO/OprP family phosphate-selective porin [Phenylobacterium sp.]|uniref:OprO/OprP family phosphate-selective porin n=1 Tax=Phenylobacterium sp. TaxID=1871053 RepID=UPI002FDAA130
MSTPKAPAAMASALIIAMAGTPVMAQAPLPPEVAALIEAQAAKIRDLEARLERLEAKADASPLPTAQSQPPKPPPISLALAPAPQARSSDRALEPLTVRGRLQADALVFNNDEGSVSTGTQLRRLRLGVKGDVSERFGYVADVDFAGGSVNLQDAYLRYKVSEGLELVAGHLRPSISADELTSSNHTIFLERSAYATTFAPGRRLGVAAHAWGEAWGVRAGLFGERDASDLDTERKESSLAALRVHGDLLPGDPALHLAVSTYHARMPDRGPGVWLRVRPETNRAPRLLDTGAFIASEAAFWGLEVGYGAGPLTLQAEGGRVDYGGPISAPDYDGWSAQAAWRWTGEGRPYDIQTGTFGRITPDRPLGQGGFGAVETGLRVTHVDLGDEAVHGGEMTTQGLVVNWHPVTRVRLSGNLIQARIERLSAPALDEVLLTLRAAVDW